MRSIVVCGAVLGVTSSAPPRLGTSLPQFGGAVDDSARIADVARQAEELGAASLWVGDRLLAAVDPEVGYAGGGTVPERFRRALDPFVVLAAAAVSTTRAVLGTSVIIAPLYPPAELARSLTSLQAISGGRVLAGLGVGWSPEEYAAAGVGFDRRGARLEELLDALDVLFAGGRAGYAGRFVTVPPSYVEAPSPPVRVGLGAYADAALRRVARRADVWLPALSLPGPRTAADAGAWLRARRGILDAAARDAGRDPDDIATVLRVNLGADARLPRVASDLATVLETTGFTDAFVDPMAFAPAADDALAAFAAVHDRLVAG